MKRYQYFIACVTQCWLKKYELDYTVMLLHSTYPELPITMLWDACLWLYNLITDWTMVPPQPAVRVPGLSVYNSDQHTVISIVLPNEYVL